MKPVLFAAFAFVLLFATAAPRGALASGGSSASYLRFAWSTAEIPAVITLPLPPELEAGEIDRIDLAADARLVGFEVDRAAGELVLHLLPTRQGPVSFSAVDVGLRSGRDKRFEFGAATLVRSAARSGPLTFERSLSATAGGLYQAVALLNAGERDLLITGASYLPTGSPAGRLLVASRGDPVALLARLEEAMTPAARREAEVRGGSYPVVEGFGWRSADELEVRLAPRESVVLAWTDRALPAGSGSTSFELQPVVEYRLVAESAAGGSRMLGLPVVVRRQP